MNETLREDPQLYEMAMENEVAILRAQQTYLVGHLGSAIEAAVQSHLRTGCEDTPVEQCARAIRLDVESRLSGDPATDDLPGFAREGLPHPRCDLMADCPCWAAGAHAERFASDRFCPTCGSHLVPGTGTAQGSLVCASGHYSEHGYALASEPDDWTNINARFLSGSPALASEAAPASGEGRPTYRHPDPSTFTGNRRGGPRFTAAVHERLDRAYCFIRDCNLPQHRPLASTATPPEPGLDVERLAADALLPAVDPLDGGRNDR